MIVVYDSGVTAYEDGTEDEGIVSVMTDDNGVTIKNGLAYFVDRQGEGHVINYRAIVRLECFA